MEDWHLIVGLGNPGSEYARTRHNAGFLLVERLAERWRAAWREEEGFQARLAVGGCAGRRCLLCEPLTYMNLSGQAVSAVSAYYKVGVERMLVVVDDADLPLGVLRMRPRGSSAGHHGLESVESHVGTREYARLRLGIGRQPGDTRRITGHVLGRFGTGERELLTKVLERGVEAVEHWLTAGVEAAMNRFNGAVVAPETKD